MGDQTEAERSDRRRGDRRHNAELDFGPAERRKADRRGKASGQN